MPPESTPVSATCHCGRVSVAVVAKPDFINACNCSLCSSRGAWWGYYRSDQVTVRGDTSPYSRADRAEPKVAVHFCPECGVTSHWTQTEAFLASNPQDAGWMGVNMRLFTKEALAGVELRFPDGKGWDGVGGYGYVRGAGGDWGQLS